MIHLYALAGGPVEASLGGIDGRPVTSVAIGELYAIVTTHTAPVARDAAAALAHVAAIDAIADHVDLVPVRFGPGHSDEEALRAHLAPVVPELRSLLDRVGGHVEYLVRRTLPDGAARDDGAPAAEAPDGPGRAYLERRRDAELASEAAHRARQAELRAATDGLVAHAVDVRDVVTRRGPERCFLVARATAPDFESWIRSLGDRDADLVVGGPWPPFTFASLPVGTGASL
ncbi:MAG: GvpL/GvpF family gas vesicle protein [Nitriliruptor sp.]